MRTHICIHIFAQIISGKDEDKQTRIENDGNRENELTLYRDSVVVYKVVFYVYDAYE